MKTEKLNNPTWYSLSEIHKSFCIEYKGIKFYRQDYCSFGGYIDPNATKVGIDKYSLLENSFYVVGDRPIFSDNVQLKKELVCKQMLLEKQIDFVLSESITEIKMTKQKKRLV